MTERVLGVDYVILKGRGGRDTVNGATMEGDTFIHLGGLLDRVTACDKGWKDFMLTYADVEINCPDCISKLVKVKK